MARDPPLPLGALEHEPDVVAPVHGLAEAPVARELRPAPEEVAVVAVVHHVDEVAAARARADLAEDRLAARVAEPLHVGEPGAQPERPHHAAGERLRVAELGGVRVAEGDLRGADPLVHARLERAREVLGDAVEHGLAVLPQGVEGELVTVDVLLDGDLGHVAQPGRDSAAARRRRRPGRCPGRPPRPRAWMHTGKPISWVAAMHSATLWARMPCGVRRPAAATWAFIFTLSRNRIGLLGEEPGAAGAPPELGRQQDERLPQGLDAIHVRAPRSSARSPRPPGRAPATRRPGGSRRGGGARVSGTWSSGTSPTARTRAPHLGQAAGEVHHVRAGSGARGRQRPWLHL